MTTIKKERTIWDINYGEGFKHRIWFDNGYGISLIYHKASYGLECVLMHKDDDEQTIHNNKKFNQLFGGDFVKYNMKGKDLLEVLKLVKKLKAK